MRRSGRLGRWLLSRRLDRLGRWLPLRRSGRLSRWLPLRRSGRLGRWPLLRQWDQSVQYRRLYQPDPLHQSGLLHPEFPALPVDQLVPAGLLVQEHNRYSRLVGGNSFQQGNKGNPASTDANRRIHIQMACKYSWRFSPLDLIRDSSIPSCIFYADAGTMVTGKASL